MNLKKNSSGYVKFGNNHLNDILLTANLQDDVNAHNLIVRKFKKLKHA